MNNKFLKTNYLILGAGLSGIAAAFFLNDDFLIIEKQDKIGGLCQTNSYNGFLYDFTGHLLHFKNNDIKDFVLNKLLKNNYIEQKRNSFVYLKNKYIPFPYQYNLSYLDNSQITNSILSLLIRPKKKSDSLFDFFLANYGQKISSDFFIPYNYKILNFNLKKLHYSQLYKFIPDYEEEKIIIGAFIRDKFNDIGYNSIFYYPAKNGIIELINSFNINKEKIILNKYPINILLNEKKVELNDGTIINYNKLISTIPLPDLLELLKIKNNLKYSSILNLNILLNEKKIEKIHWLYFPEKKYKFYRIGFYHNIAEYFCPDKNYSSMYVEASLPKKEENKFIKKIIDQLLELQFISSKRNIIKIIPQKIKYAFVLFDFYTIKKIKKIRSELAKNEIYLSGRYGNWEYSSMEENILNAKELIKKIKCV